MSTQPEALQVADALDDEFTQGRISNHNGRKAAVELRRLYAENQTLRQEKTDAYNEGVSAGIYKARNALTDLYRL